MASNVVRLESLSNTTTKYTLAVLNLFFALCGVVAFIAGVGLLATEASSVSGVDASLGIFLTVGIICTLVSVFGLWGSLRESTCFLRSYAGSLIALVVLQILAGGLLIGYTDTAWRGIRWIFESAKNGDQSLAATVDDIQTYFECCGYESPSFWAPPGQTDASLLPTSCCKGSLLAICIPMDAYSAGCRYAFGNFVRDYGVIFGAVGLTVGLLQGLGIWFALVMASRLNSLKRRMNKM